MRERGREKEREEGGFIAGGRKERRPGGRGGSGIFSLSTYQSDIEKSGSFTSELIRQVWLIIVFILLIKAEGWRYETVRIYNKIRGSLLLFASIASFFSPNKKNLTPGFPRQSNKCFLFVMTQLKSLYIKDIYEGSGHFLLPLAVYSSV